MKKQRLSIVSLLSLALLAGCSSEVKPASSVVVEGSDYTYNSKVGVSSVETIDVEDSTGEFTITTTDGEYTKEGSVYTLNKAGTYALSGKLVGQILVAAGEDEEVVIELNGVTIEYSQDSPVKCLSASKVEISAKKDSENVIRDKRNAKAVDVDSQGEGAIYAKTDLKLKGSGVLVVEGGYNNGVHTSKDLTIQKLTLKSTGYNNAIKGNNSVTLTSGTIQAYAKTGNGIKTEDSDLTSKGKQKGTITVNGGSIYVDSLHDAFDASYNVEINEADAEAPTQIVIKTGTNSTVYNKSSFTATSEKGLKAKNDIIINAGEISIAASDDAIHANYGDALENGSTGTGNITVNGGNIEVASGDDGLHADNTLTINEGRIVVSGATEGLEANYIVVNGGKTYVYGSDDGVNASKKSFNNCSFTMNGGYLDVAVRSGDTDGIDSNGNFTLAGGVIVSRGSPGTSLNRMSTALDCDGTASMTGGTFIAFNGMEKTPTAKSGILYASTTSTSSSGGGGFNPGRPGGGGGGTTTGKNLSAGNYVLSGDNVSISFTNDYQYGSFTIYSDALTSGSTYTLTCNNTTMLSWTQSSNSTSIS